MKTENAELKQTLANFGKNYNKFEDSVNDIIRQNRDEQLKLLNSLHERYEKKLNDLELNSKQMNANHEKKMSELKSSNDMLNENLETTTTNLTDKIKKDMYAMYEKIDKNATERLQKYTENIERLEKKSRRFWCMCLAMLIFVGKAALDMWGVNFPVMVWQIVYPCAFIPLVGYAIRVIADKSPNNKMRNSFFGKKR